MGRFPWGVSDVWQMQDLERCVFGSVAMVGLTGAFSDLWQRKELGNPSRQGRNLRSASLRAGRGRGIGLLRGRKKMRDRRGWRLTITTYVTTEVLYLSRQSWSKFGSDWRGRV